MCSDEQKISNLRKRVIDIDAIQDADSQFDDKGGRVVTFRFAGLERPLRIAGPLAETLWFALVANAAPIFAVVEQPAQHPAPAATDGAL